MIPKEILKQVRRIQIRTNRLVNDVFAGQYGSIFKGRGMEFSEVRQYQMGDDVRTIDWNVTARYGHPFVKKFTEERELTIILAVDMSASQHFSSSEKLKSEVAAEIASIVAFSSIKNNDKVGMIVFTDCVEKYVPPRKTTSHALRIIRDILYYKPTGKKTEIAPALEYIYRMQKKKAVVFVLSDFMAENFQKALRIIAKKHDCIAINIADPAEEKIPPVGFIKFIDNETGEFVTLNASDGVFASRYEDIVRRHRERLNEIFSGSKVDAVNLYTGKSYIDPLIKFFYLRQRKRWR